MVEVYPGHSGSYSFSTRIHLGDGSLAARRQNGSYGSSRSRKRNKRRRWRSWGLRKARALGRNYSWGGTTTGEELPLGRNYRWGGTTAVTAHALLHGIGRQGVGGRGALSFVSSLCEFPWASLLFLGTGLGRGQKGSLQRAATAQTVDRKTGQNVSRHDLYRSYVSMIKQKKT